MIQKCSKLIGVRLGKMDSGLWVSPSALLEAFLDFKQRECQPSRGLICFDSKTRYTAELVACVAK